MRWSRDSGAAWQQIGVMSPHRKLPGQVVPVLQALALLQGTGTSTAKPGTRGHPAKVRQWVAGPRTAGAQVLRPGEGVGEAVATGAAQVREQKSLGR